MLKTWSVFQSAPPHGGDRVDVGATSATRGFNPRPRTGGDDATSDQQPLRLVSIRAPARGATFPPAALTSPRLFQSAPPHGGRLEKVGAASDVQPVSIRAPARGATRPLCVLGNSKGFQSAPPHGGRRPARIRVRYVRSFQSAPPHGGRRAWRRPRETPTHSFNPRPRTGGDVVLHGAKVLQNVFQSAPPHGGRHGSRPGWCLSDQFQSAPPHGGRPSAS